MWYLALPNLRLRWDSPALYAEVAWGWTPEPWPLDAAPPTDGRIVIFSCLNAHGGLSHRLQPEWLRLLVVIRNPLRLLLLLLLLLLR